MPKRRRKLVHFLDFDTRVPLCGGDSPPEPTNFAVNGVAICGECARLMAEKVGDASDPVVPLPLLQ